MNINVTVRGLYDFIQFLTKDRICCADHGQIFLKKKILAISREYVTIILHKSYILEDGRIKNKGIAA